YSYSHYGLPHSTSRPERRPGLQDFIPVCLHDFPIHRAPDERKQLLVELRQVSAGQIPAPVERAGWVEQLGAALPIDAWPQIPGRADVKPVARHEPPQAPRLV